MAQTEAEKTTLSNAVKTESMVVDSGISFFSSDCFGEKPERRKHLPDQLLARYIRDAINHADLRRLEDGTWFGEVSGFPGVWASSDAPEETITELREVLFDWIVLKIDHEDRDLPQLSGINLNLI
jgi:predicted RNase H-like HicB family nuclease